MCFQHTRAGLTHFESSKFPLRNVVLILAPHSRRTLSLATWGLISCDHTPLTKWHIHGSTLFSHTFQFEKWRAFELGEIAFSFVVGTVQCVTVARLIEFTPINSAPFSIGIICDHAFPFSDRSISFRNVRIYRSRLSSSLSIHCVRRLHFDVEFSCST